MILARTYSATLLGVDAHEVEIESFESGGLPRMVLVGLPDASVRESRERVAAALASCGFVVCEGGVTVNLAPAKLRKEGPGFDLPIAISLLAHRARIPMEQLQQSMLIGELALNGELRPVRGVLAVALEARARGRRRLLLPKAQAAEASVVEGLEIIGVSHLREVVDFLCGLLPLEPEPCRAEEMLAVNDRHDIDLSEVRGQQSVKRALEVAAAGGHNLLMVGPPGTGKSMLAKRMVTILPPMTQHEAIASSKIYSAGGLLAGSGRFVGTRPFRSPHHSISDAGLLGGGSNPGPGEVSLAHHGVLFLDELPEFRRSTLEVMRQPLEDGQVTISRAVGSVTFPASFILVAAMNPCPCGYFGDAKRACRCPLGAVQKYRQRLSGPLLDRVDLHLDVPAVDHRELTRQDHGGEEGSAAVRARVIAARRIQQERFTNSRGTPTNAAMSPRQLRRFCGLDSRGQWLLEQAMLQKNFSARAHDRILKVARTLADLRALERIDEECLLEAIAYRSLDRPL